MAGRIVDRRLGSIPGFALAPCCWSVTTSLAEACTIPTEFLAMHWYMPECRRWMFERCRLESENKIIYLLVRINFIPNRFELLHHKINFSIITNINDISSLRGLSTFIAVRILTEGIQSSYGSCICH